MIGHSEAGKTSFIDRLLEKEFQEKRNSTEGIDTHFITSFFNKNILHSKTWTERTFEASVPEKDFHQSVLTQISSREFESKIVERMVEHQLQNIPCTATGSPPVKGLSPQELSHSVDHQSPSRDISSSEKDLPPKDSLEIDSNGK